MFRFIFAAFLLLTMSNATAGDVDQCAMASTILKEVPPLLMPTLQKMNSEMDHESFQQWNTTAFARAYEQALARANEIEMPANKFKYMLVVKSFTALKNSNILADDVYYYLKDKTDKNKNKIKNKTDFVKSTLKEFQTKCPDEFKANW